MTSSEMNWLQFRASQNPEKVFIYYDKKEFSYAQIFSKAVKYVRALKEHTTSGKVAILLENSVENISLICAFTMLENELVLLNTRLHPQELNWQLQFLDVELLISSSHFSQTHRSLPIPTLLVDNEKHFEDLNHDIPLENILSVNSESIFCYIFTSGTTGRPKAVPLTFGNFYASALASQIRLDLNKDDIWLLNMPIYHLGGLSIVFRAIISNFSIVLHRDFDVARVVEDGKTYQITFISLVPATLRRMMVQLQKIPSIRILLVGGAATSRNLIEKAIEYKIPIAITYGMTETCSQFATAPPELVKNKLGTVGKPLDGEIKIFEPNIDGIGEIGVKGPMVTSGYYNSDIQPIDQGYFKTGDLGYIDNEGDLFVLQRRVDLIISGGENIYPSEVEMLLYSVPEVSEACIFGIEDEKWGQIPVACLELTESITRSSLVSYLKDHLAPYKVPKKWYTISEMPRTSLGKIKRSSLIQRFPDGMNVLI